MAVENKESMLDVVLKQMKAENRDQVIHCTTLVSRLSAGVNDKRDVGGNSSQREVRSSLPPVHYEILFKQCHQQYQGEGPTGLLLVYPQHVVHIVEGCWELLEAVIKDSCDMDANSGLLTDTRILHFSTNVMPRLYQQWAYRVLPLPTLPKQEAYETTETIAQTVSSALSILYSLGVYLSTHQHQVKSTLDNLPQKFLLQQDLLEYFTQCCDLDTPTQFVTRYCRPTQVVLDSECVWPLPTRLFPYDD